MDTPLCRVCIKKAAECTPLNTKIEDSSNLTFFDFLNKCASLNTRERDNLPQSLCSICSHSIKTFYSFVKLAERSDIILRKALKNSIARGRYNDNRELSCEEIEIQNGKMEKESADFIKEESFYCQTSTNSTVTSLYTIDIIKEEPGVSESTSIVQFKESETNESNKFHSNLHHPEGSIEEPDDILSYKVDRLASIDAEHCDSEDDVNIRLLKRTLVKYEDESDSESNFLSKVHCIPSNVKKKAGKTKGKSKKIIKEGASDPQSIHRPGGLIENNEKSCEEVTTIKNRKIKEESVDFNKEDSLHCQTSTNALGPSLYILDIVKEEPCVSESASIVEFKESETDENDKFHYKLDYTEESIDESEDILSCINGRLASKEENSDSEDDVNIRLLKRKLIKNEDDSDSQSIKIEYDDHIFKDQASSEANDDPLKPQIHEHTENTYKCIECDIAFKDREEFMAHYRSHIYGDKHKCYICGKMFARRRYLYNHLLIHEAKKKHKCSICGKKFAKRNYLYNHLVTHEEKKKYKCSICGKVFKHTSARCRHMKMHSDKKPFECEICGKKFSLKDRYNRHMRVHTRPHELSDKKHECEICSKKFCSKQYLNFHMENHKGIAKKCNQCDKEFKNTHALSRHMKRHNNPKLFKCENCGKSLSRKCTYTRHMEICKSVSNSIVETLAID